MNNANQTLAKNIQKWNSKNMTFCGLRSEDDILHYTYEIGDSNENTEKHMWTTR